MSHHRTVISSGTKRYVWDYHSAADININYQSSNLCLLTLPFPL